MPRLKLNSQYKRWKIYRLSPRKWIAMKIMAGWKYYLEDSSKELLKTKIDWVESAKGR